MDEKVMQEALTLGELGGTPSEARAIEFAYEAGQKAARHECAMAILQVPMYPGFVLDLCRGWMKPAPSGSDDNG